MSSILTSVFFSLFQREEAIKMVAEAISAGIFNDLGSGSNVDVCIITKDNTEMLRNFEMPNERPTKDLSYKFPRGTTAWKREDVRQFVVSETRKPHTVGVEGGTVPPVGVQGEGAMEVDVGA